MSYRNWGKSGKIVNLEDCLWGCQVIKGTVVGVAAVTASTSQVLKLILILIISI